MVKTEGLRMVKTSVLHTGEVTKLKLHKSTQICATKLVKSQTCRSLMLMGMTPMMRSMSDPLSQHSIKSVSPPMSALLTGYSNISSQSGSRVRDM